MWKASESPLCLQHRTPQCVCESVGVGTPQSGRRKNSLLTSMKHLWNIYEKYCFEQSPRTTYEWKLQQQTDTCAFTAKLCSTKQTSYCIFSVVEKLNACRVAQHLKKMYHRTAGQLLEEETKSRHFLQILLHLSQMLSPDNLFVFSTQWGGRKRDKAKTFSHHMVIEHSELKHGEETTNNRGESLDLCAF